MPKSYRVAIDWLRAASYGGILCVHVTLLFGDRFPEGSAAWRLCQSMLYASGTIVFFGLASFHLCRTLLAGEDAWSALSRRMQRVYPPYLLMMTIYLALMCVIPAVNKAPEGSGAKALYVLTNLLMLPGLVPQLPTVLAVGWAIGCVVWCYLLIACLYDWVGLRQWSRTARAALWIAVAAALHWFAGSVEYFSMVKISGFAFGALAAELPYPLGIWRTARPSRQTPEGAIAAMLNQDGIRGSSRLMASYGYHALLCQGLAMHAIEWTYPFGAAPGVLDWAAIVTAASLLSFAGGWALRQTERTLWHWGAAVWARCVEMPRPAALSEAR